MIWWDCMPDKDFDVLSSPSRLRIYQTLLRRPNSTDDLGRILGLSNSSLRFHLRALESSGLVTRKTEAPKGRGRPKIIWTVDRTIHIEGFPIRQYGVLSEILLRSMMKLAKRKDEIGKVLLEVGREVGSDIIRHISQSKSVSSWGSDEFRKHYIGEHLEATGIVSEVEKCTEKEVVFSHYNCPFEELAIKYTKEICDYLDTGYYEGLVAGMGGIAQIERVSCLAHGDDKCTYILRWQKARKKAETSRSAPLLLSVVAAYHG